MTSNIQNIDTIAESIELKETELKELLVRVMAKPLQPLLDQAKQLEKRLGHIEVICRRIDEEDLLAMNLAIREQAEELKKRLKSMQMAIPNEVREMLKISLASMPQEVTHLLEGQTFVKNQLSQVQDEQILLGKVSVQSAQKMGDHIDDGRESIEQSLGRMQIEGRLVLDQLVRSVSDLALNLNELKLHSETTFVSLARQTAKHSEELSIALQIMQKRFLWLGVLGGLSFAGLVALLVSRFLVHL